MKKEDIEQHVMDLPGGGKSIITFHRPLWISGAHPKRPLRLEVTTPLQITDNHGMPDGAEVPKLDSFEFRLEALVKRRTRGELVMHVTGSRQRTFVFYMANRVGLVAKKDAQAAIGDSIAKLASKQGRQATLTWHEDPEWSRLTGIYPVWDPEQWKEDRRLLTHMAKQNDAIHTRRPIAHRLYFEKREQCRDFLRAARQLKFKADGGPKLRKSGGFVVLIERIEPTIATWHLHPIVLTVKALAVKHGGSYDGWETTFVQTLVPPPLNAPRGG